MAKQRKENPEPKASKRAQYPYYSLQKCLEVSEAVRDCGGARGEVQKSVLAHHLKVDENAAAFSQLIGSTKCFGLMEGWGSYTLSDAAKEYYFPTDDSQKRRAMLKVLKSPEVFARLIDRFDGARVPPNQLLANILHREYAVPESWMPRVASLFVGSLKEAGVIDSSGFLRYNSTMHANPTVTDLDPPLPPPPIEKPNVHQPPPVFERQHPAHDDGVTTLWVHRGVRLETPIDLTYDLWDRLNKYVQVIKPAEPPRKESP